MESSDEFEPILQYHAVLLYDVLGQSAKLHQIKSIPSCMDQERELSQALQSTAGAVLKMRTHVSGFYERVAKSSIDPQALPPEHRQLFIDARHIDLKIRNFSDLTVANVPLKEETGSELPITSVAALIGAAASMMIVSLAGGTPIRGAIDVGLAVDLDQDEIYGPILDCVYIAESQHAQWPRILVGEELLHYLDACIGDTGDNPIASIKRGHALKWRECIVEDIDGLYVVDYLGHAIRKLMGSGVRYEVIEKMLEFVHAELHRFKDEGSKKLVERYEKVVAYCEERKSIWK